MMPPPAHRRLTLRSFLHFVVGMIVLVAAVLFTLRLYQDELTQFALVPDAAFAEQPALGPNAWADPAMWISHPRFTPATDPSRWMPERDVESSLPHISPPPPPAGTASPRFAVFFVHPTSFFSDQRWNAPLDDADSRNTAQVMVRGMASAFGEASEVWAPRYRQATFGAFLTDSPEAGRALDAAYADVAQAFAAFLAAIPEDMPIVLAGHSQGAAHVLRLVEDKVAGQPISRRVAMVYPIGWPISLEHDLPATGLSACDAPDAAPCVMGWASFAEPADPGQFLRRYAALPGNDGAPRGESPILCVNPLTGVAGSAAAMNRNMGTLVPEEDLSGGRLVAGAVPARCDADTGLLLIGDPPQLGPHAFPGNNYHVYDIPLFWANLRHDVNLRMRAWTARQN